VITREDVLSAHRRIEKYVRRTPLLRAKTPSEPLWLKCEFLQHTGFFKVRGAFNRLLAARARGELDPTRRRRFTGHHGTEEVSLARVP
jgi:threonine dehydratase